MGKENSNTPEQTWVSLRDAAPLFGLSFETITNMVAQDKFPVPTYKLGRRRVIDKEVMQAFFDEQKAEGLRRLQSRPTNTKHR
jgi:hypothetical protein